MKEVKFCENCKRNYAVRTYEENGTARFYCLDCYSQLLLEEDSADGKLSVCPYCGMTLIEVIKGKLVGCAHCYQTMQAGLFPMIKKMQGGKAHRGKTPPVDVEFGDFSLAELEEKYRKEVIQGARFERQTRELKIIIEHLQAEGKFEEAKSYEEKLNAMQSRSTVEEDFVWRTSRTLSKKS